jgi:hypothetical protein
MTTPVSFRRTPESSPVLERAAISLDPGLRRDDGIFWIPAKWAACGPG